jgi:Importin-beta N-terminal domain
VRILLRVRPVTLCAASRLMIPASEPQIRQSAGLLLKNNLKQQYAGTPPDYQEYIKVATYHHATLLPAVTMRLWTSP